MKQITIFSILVIFLFCSSPAYSAEEYDFTFAILKYNGGGDWYNDPSAEINLLKFINQETTIKVNPEYVFVA